MRVEIKNVQDKFSDRTVAECEMILFAERTPDFFKCEENIKALVDFCNSKNWPIDMPHLEKAHVACKSEGKEFVPTAERIQQMTAEEARRLYEMNGVPQYDNTGRIVGYNLPETWGRMPVVDSADSPRLRQQSMMKHPEDHGKKPTKREWAMWSADRQREWMESAGVWGHALPRYLR